MFAAARLVVAYLEAHAAVDQASTVSASHLHERVRELRQGLLTLGVPRLVFWTHAEVVLPLWRDPAEERRPGTLAPAVEFTSALEAGHALCLRGSGQERGAHVEPDDPEE